MSASVSSAGVGVWLIGARGSVATTLVTSGAAVTAGLQPPTGLVTETPTFADSGLPSAVAAELAVADREFRPGGPVPGTTRSEDGLIGAFAADIQDFVRRCGLTRAVVVSVASTEPAPIGGALPPNSLYAAAALRAGCAPTGDTAGGGAGAGTVERGVARSGDGAVRAGRRGEQR